MGETGSCTRCLDWTHNVFTCFRAKNVCAEDGCNEPHHEMIHPGTAITTSVHDPQADHDSRAGNQHDTAAQATILDIPKDPEQDPDPPLSPPPHPAISPHSYRQMLGVMFIIFVKKKRLISIYTQREGPREMER